MVKNRTIGTWSPSSVGDVFVLRFPRDGNHNPAAFILALMNRTVPGCTVSGWRYRKFFLFASGFSLFLNSPWWCRQRAHLTLKQRWTPDHESVSPDCCDILELGCWSPWFLMCLVTDSIRTTDLPEWDFHWSDWDYGKHSISGISSLCLEGDLPLANTWKNAKAVSILCFWSCFWSCIWILDEETHFNHGCLFESLLCRSAVVVWETAN